MKKYEVSFTRHIQHSVTMTVSAEDEDAAQTIARDKLFKLDEKGKADWEETDSHIDCDGAEPIAKGRR